MLSSSGICSRRQAESLIKEGRLTVNNEISHLGQKIDHNDLVRIDGKIVDLSNQNSKLRVLMYNKDLGEISSKNDPESRKTIFDSLPKINGGNWFSVGRLDINSEGLLLLTNDGEFARKLELPSSGMSRIYRVRVYGIVKEQDLSLLKNGITIDKIRYGSISTKLEKQKNSNAWITMELKEGKNREIRKIMSFFGYRVNKLIRI